MIHTVALALYRRGMPKGIHTVDLVLLGLDVPARLQSTPTISYVNPD